MMGGSRQAGTLSGSLLNRQGTGYKVNMDQYKTTPSQTKTDQLYMKWKTKGPNE